MDDVGRTLEVSKPYLVMTSSQLCLALHLALLQSVLDPSRAASPIVFVLYEQVVSALLLLLLALLFERGKTPRLSFSVLSSAFFVAFLQIPLGELMLTASLRYITATFQSVALNTIPALVFLLAVASRREGFRFWALNGQAKVWGILTSVAGAIVVVVLSDPGVNHSELSTGSPADVGRLIGCLMVGLAVLAEAVGNLWVERLALKYPADLTLSAILNTFGTIQTAIAAAFMERNPSSWRIRWSDKLQLFAILYGGIVVTGISYFARNWCIHKKGPVFGSAFGPLLVVFSFLLQTLMFHRAAQFWSIVGAVLVVGGLYLLLWAKSKDCKIPSINEEGESYPFEGLSEEPLLLNKP